MSVDPEKALLEHVTAQLQAFSISDETYAQYISQLALDDMPAQEKKDIIVEFLESATESSTESFVEEVLQMAQDLVAKKEEEKRLEREALLQKAKESEALALAAEKANAKPATLSKPELSKSEKKKRELLLSTYGFDVDEIVEGEDGEAEVLYKGASEDKKSDSTLLKNDNVERVKAAEQQRRAKLASEHTQRVERDKAALKKQLEDKEKEKKRVMKKEKRRM